MSRKVQLSSLLLTIAGIWAAQPTMASTLTVVTHIDLQDVVQGEDLWSSSYRFTGAIEPFGGFNVTFSPQGFRSVEVVSSPIELDVLVIQPDSALPAEGLVNFTLLQPTQIANYVAAFTVSYIKLGGLRQQAYEVFDGNFSIVESGNVSAVPEPAAVKQLLFGLLVMAGGIARQRWHRSVRRVRLPIAAQTI